MNQRLLIYGCGCLFLAGLLLAGGWMYGEPQTSGDAWTLDRTEQTLSSVSPGQEVKVAFRLKNTSRRPLRIVGGSSC